MSERSFYRVLHALGQAHRRGWARPPQESRPVPRLRADGPNQLWNWDITYLPTSVRGVWLYLYLVVDVWSRKVVAWDVAEREDAQIAADLVGRACLRERISRSRPQPLMLHADNGNAMRAATLENRLEELGVLRSFSRPRVSNDNPYSESLFRTVKYRPDYPRRPHPQQRRCLPVGGGIRGLVHPPALPQRHPVRDPPPAPQRRARRTLPSSRPRLRAVTSAAPPSLESKHPLLATPGVGLDQSTASRKRHRSSYVRDGHQIGGRGVIFTGSYRCGRSGGGAM
ncbi:DDE-type integrase/transposase/recombinase [Synechococcus sp. J7-Johnson]|uniref:DDE-type integrase/transposase/recombinase n=1 Tax=Synechococcus sp. J7-Johnson TaxID=2823737 RepID=UPI0020CE807F|nr:DDE-type integrase/transposase/recombinase [Synechococcus sp. J7-Johnson]